MYTTIVLTLITRFAQLIGVVAVLTGVSMADALWEYLTIIRLNQPWTAGELGLRFVKVAGPCFVGSFMVIGTQYLLQTVTIAERRKKQFPQEPWRWNPMWDTNHIRLNNRALVMVLLFFWGIFVFIVLPAGICMASIKLKAGIYFFIGAFGLVLFGISNHFWKNRRWNRSELIMGTMPGVIGGPFRAVAVLPEVFPPDTQFRLQLRCNRTTFRRGGRGESTSSHTDTIWQTEVTVGRQIDSQSSDKTAIPVSFAIPYDCQPTETAHRSSTDWFLVLKLRSEQDLREAVFPVPVFRTANSSPDFRPEDEAFKPFIAKFDVSTILERIGMRREQRIDGREQISFSMRQPGILPGVTLLAVVCISAIVASFVWLTSPVVWFAALLPAVLLLISLWGLIEILFWSSSLSIGPDEVTIEAGYQSFQSKLTFHRSLKTSELPLPDDSEIVTVDSTAVTVGEFNVPFECKIEFKKSDGEWWSVCVPDQDGELQPLVRRLNGQQEAECVRDWLSDLIRSSSIPLRGK